MFPGLKFSLQSKILDNPPPFWQNRQKGRGIIWSDTQLYLNRKINVCEKTEKTPQYTGVYWNRKNRKWYVLLSLKGQGRKYGGTFKDELDAAKRVNQLCEELGIPPQNPAISAMPNQQHQVTRNFVLSQHCKMRTVKVYFFNSFQNIFCLRPKPSLKLNILTFFVFLKPKINLYDLFMSSKNFILNIKELHGTNKEKNGMF